MNVREAMQQELVNISQFLYHVTPVVAFQIKSWSDWTFCWGFKFSIFLLQVLFFRNFRTLPMICKLSPVEVSLFQRKKMAPEQKMLIIWSQGCSGQKTLFVDFLILKIPHPWWNPDFTKFLPVMHFQIWSESKSRVKNIFCTFSRYLKGIVNWKSFDQSISTKTLWCIFKCNTCM